MNASVTDALHSVLVNVSDCKDYNGRVECVIFDVSLGRIVD